MIVVKQNVRQKKAESRAKQEETREKRPDQQQEATRLRSAESKSLDRPLAARMKKKGNTQKELQKLRDMYDDKMQEHRDYFEERYQNRYRELQSQITLRHGSTAGSAQELKESRYRIDALLKKIAELEHDNLSLNQKIADMVQEMKEQPVIHQEELSSKDGEMQRIIHQLSDQMTEYQKLHEIKIALDMEIAVFHHLLESEEDRFEEIVEENREDREEPFTIEKRTTIRNSERRMMLRSDDPAEIK